MSLSTITVCIKLLKLQLQITTQVIKLVIHGRCQDSDVRGQQGAEGRAQGGNRNKAIVDSRLCSWCATNNEYLLEYRTTATVDMHKLEHLVKFRYVVL